MNDVPLYYKDINFNCSFENSKGVNYLEEVLRYKNLNCNIILAPSAWVEKRNASPEWSLILRARAIDLSAYVIGSDMTGSIGRLKYSGKSAVISPEGKVLKKFDSKKDGIINIAII